MSRLVVRSFGVSIDGYGAGPKQDLQKSRTVSNPDGSELSESSSESRVGEPEFLKIAAAAWKAVREMHGLDEPEQVNLNAKMLVATGTVQEIAELLRRTEAIVERIERMERVVLAISDAVLREVVPEMNRGPAPPPPPRRSPTASTPSSPRRAA